MVTVNDVRADGQPDRPHAADATNSVSFTASATDISPAVQAAGFTYSWNFGDGATAPAPARATPLRPPGPTR